MIDYEPHATAGWLEWLGRSQRSRGGAAGPVFDRLASLLYVDRRGAPENRQAGLDTPGKLARLLALAETAQPDAIQGQWVTEVNWPLQEGPHSPAGRDVAVDEERQAWYLMRYYLLALASGLCERVFWWQPIAKGYGLIDPTAGPSSRGVELRRRLSFEALAELSRELLGARFEQRLSVEVPVWALRFTKPGGEQLVVAWSADDQERTVMIEGESVRVGPRPIFGTAL